MDKGSVSPDSVEQKARTLAQRTLDSIRPVIGSAGTSVGRTQWQKCTTDTPGQHRFDYSYQVTLDVPEEGSKAVMDAAEAHFAKEGYVPDLPDPKTPRVGAKDPHSSWWVGVGVANGDASMFISVDSACVFTTHDPPG
ncbi:hypothetical protein [Actinacidiphila rubida]|uniref:Uncharacterized protein n=1 Tax=Actinacidiphila rubida TaxID=310780 RepID=A0A1H8EY29_9ACTN|nr:hypothetical protein [Actinacidiphila rubida]SEN24359.1 hypothetical protein SAMN05216267_100332 [Actinacidiphila rubida]